MTTRTLAAFAAGFVFAGAVVIAVDWWLNGDEYASPRPFYAWEPRS